MATTTFNPPLIHRIAIYVGLLVGLAVLFVTQDPSGATPYLMLGIAFFVALHGYFRTRPYRPWDGNDEPY